MDSEQVLVSIPYLRRISLYDHESPYRLIGIPSTPGVPATNVELETVILPILDMRVEPIRFTVESNAF